MAKTNKYVHFSTRAAFNSELSKLGITNPSVAEGNSFYYYTVYIKDTNEIYTHGRFYNQENHKILYISTDNAIVTPFDDSVFGGANIVSNTYVDEIGEIVFDRKLDTIGEAAFRGCSTIKSIILPDSIRFIEDSAFYGCSELEHIVIPKNVRNIYRAAFQQCNKLTEVTILGCPEIGANVFYGDINLLRIFLHGHKTITIDETCFSEDLPNNCFIHVPAHLLQDYKELYSPHANYFISFVESNALRTINGQSLIGSEDLSVGMNIADNEIWYTTTDGNVITPYSTATFGANIVSNTYSNGKGVIKFDADVTELGSHAFDGCSNLVTMSIPTTVTNIQTYAFYNCTGLVEFDIPDTVTTLGGYVFYKCTSLKYVNVGLGVTLLPTYMFHSCSSLVRVNVPDSITRINSYCFNGCSKLQRFTIPHSVTNIETNAFRNTSLAEVDIPNSVTTIGTHSFANCSKLRKVTIGFGVTSIASYAFSGCVAIKQIYCNAVSIPSLGSTGVFILALSAGKIYIPISLYESYISATNWSAYAQYITAYVEPSMLKTIHGKSILGSGDITIISAYPQVGHGTADTTFELTPNTFHVWDEVSELDLSLGAVTAGVANEYLFQFTSGSTATTLTLPDYIKWANDSAPVIASNKVYQISILEGLGSALEFSMPIIITFTIDGTSYQAEEGMTWEDWVNSKYNTAGSVLHGILIAIGTEIVVAPAGGAVNKTDVINSGIAYTLESATE